MLSGIISGILSDIYAELFCDIYFFLILTCVLCVLTFLTITFYLAIFLLPCIFIYSGILSDIF